MVNKPLIRPAISGEGTLGGGWLTSLERRGKHPKSYDASNHKVQPIQTHLTGLVSLDTPFGCQIPTPPGLFLVVKGPKFQTLGGFSSLNVIW